VCYPVINAANEIVYRLVHFLLVFVMKLFPACIHSNVKRGVMGKEVKIWLVKGVGSWRGGSWREGRGWGGRRGGGVGHLFPV
jgi:hypothetical protein